MARKPITFEPQLFRPVGINNFSGETFTCFTKGETLPFTFTFTDNATGLPVPVTAAKVWVLFSDIQAVSTKLVGDQTLLKVEIPLTDLATATFSGSVTDEETNTIPDGLVYAQAVYVDPDGAAHIIDMALLEVYPAASFTTL